MKDYKVNIAFWACFSFIRTREAVKRRKVYDDYERNDILGCKKGDILIRRLLIGNPQVRFLAV